MLFQNKKFLLLPNASTTRAKILTQLLKSGGGEVVTSLQLDDSGIYVLVDDQFIPVGDNKITNFELFEKELDCNVRKISKIIKENNLICVRSSLVTKWLKDNEFVINDNDTLDLMNLVENSRSIDISHPKVPKTADLATPSDGNEDTGGQKSRPMETDNSANRHEGDMALRIACKGNDRIVRILDLLQKKYANQGDHYRERGYKIAKSAIQEYPNLIESGRQAQMYIPHIGSSLSKKIQVILDSGTLPGIHNVDPLADVQEYFMYCHGVGHHTARRWATLNYRNFSDVLQKEPNSFAEDLGLLFGWSYYEDWSLRITRRECEEHFKVVKTTLSTLAPECCVEIMGSYARGAQSSGDIDLLFFIKDCDDTKRIANILESLVIQLHEVGYLVCTLQLNSKLYKTFESSLRERVSTCHLSNLYDENITFNTDKLIKKYYLGVKLPPENYQKCCDISVENSTSRKLKPEDKFMSLSRWPNDSSAPCRRLDFFIAKWSEIGASRIQWLGPSEFNRRIRLLASKKGFKLTQHGLYRGDTLLEAFDERRIFELLGVPYMGVGERERWTPETEEPVEGA